MRDLAGKTAVVTGGASGIGFALAEALVERQVQVVLADIEEEALQRSVERLETRQGRVLGVVTNVLESGAIDALLERAVTQFGPVQLLFNNAGVASASSAGLPVWALPMKDWDWVMGVNFYGVIHGLRVFIPHMLAHGEESHVVNTASLIALLSGGSTYGVSKSAVLNLTETLHEDLKRLEANIGVSLLCPNLVNTHFFSAERNRPEHTPAAQDPEMQAGLDALLANAVTPQSVAHSAIDAVESGDFYVFPESWDAFVEERGAHILARKVPSRAWDAAELMKRYERGESL